MGVSQTDSRPKDVSLIDSIVAISVSQKNHICAIGSDGPSRYGKDAGADVEAFGENRDLISDSIAIPVLKDLDAIPGSLGANLMRVVKSLYDPEPTPAIPVDCDRVDHLRFGREKPYFKPGRNLGKLQRLGRREGILDLIKGAHWILGILGCSCTAIPQSGKMLRREPAHLIVVRCPADGTMDEVVIFRQVPAAMVMTAGRIKHPAFAVGLDPAPGLIIALLQDDPVLPVALMLIGFVPALEPFPPLHHRMVLVHDAGPEHSFAMGLELGSKKVDILREVRVPEARGGTMKKHTPSSLACEIKERLPLGLDIQFIQVGKDQEHVVLSEVFFGESLYGIRVGNVDSLGPQGFPEDTEASRRVMIEEVFAP